MASSTKIINVLKDDSFAEILALFKSTPAGEVIFVLPKRSKAFQKEEHFAVLREAAHEVEKTVSFLSSDSTVNELAQKHNFEILLARSPSKPTSQKVATKVAIRSNPISVVNEIESFYERPLTQETAEPEDIEEDFAAPAMVAPAPRRMDEVIHAAKEDRRSVKISAAKEKAYPVEVHHEAEPADADDDTLEDVWAAEAVTAPRQPARASLMSRFKSSSKPAMPRSRRLLYALGGSGLALAMLLIYFNTGSAQVVINPAVTQLSFQMATIAGDNISAVDLGHLAIPGQTFTIQKSVSQTFTATGSKDVAQKARGTITLYNKTSSAQPLIATTRFQSADGHIFHSLTSITVPAAKNASTAGTVDVQVIADKIGSDYNVPAGTFTIPAFKEKGDTAKYAGITGVSTAAMHGGTSGKATVVTTDDYVKAIDALTAQLKTAVSDEAKAETAGLKIVNDTDVAIAPPTSTAVVDDAADTFTMTLSGTLKTAGFKESDLEQLISAYVDSKYTKDIVPEKLTVTYSNVQFDTPSSTLHMTVSVAGPSYTKVDQAKIMADLLGKGESQISAYLKALPGITSANVLLSPVWVRSVPRNSAKVHITVTR